MFKVFIDNIASKEQIVKFIETFKEGDELGTAFYEFHNDEEFRIYIKNGEKDIMLTFQTKEL